MGAQQNVVVIASIVQRRERENRKKTGKSALDRYPRIWNSKRVVDRRNMLGLSVLRAKKRERRARKNARYECGDGAQIEVSTSAESARG